MSFSFHGIGASKGIAIGKVHIVTRGIVEVPEYTLKKSEIEKEVARFETAIEGARADLGAIKEQIPPDTDIDIAAFIDTHLLMLDDSAITKVPIKLIREERRNAEWALKVQRDALVSVLGATDADVLALQEVMNIHEERLNVALADAYPYHWYHEASGLAVYSAHPILDREIYPAEPWSVQSIVIRVHDTPLHVINAHLAQVGVLPALEKLCLVLPIRPSRFVPYQSCVVRIGQLPSYPRRCPIPTL